MVNTHRFESGRLRPLRTDEKEGKMLETDERMEAVSS